MLIQKIHNKYGRLLSVTKIGWITNTKFVSKVITDEKTTFSTITNLDALHQRRES